MNVVDYLAAAGKWILLNFFFIDVSLNAYMFKYDLIPC